MKKQNTSVRTKTGESWEYTGVLPDSCEEAVSTYGETGTLFLIQTALVVKQQGIAREGFRKEMSREDVDAAVELYKPGSKRGGGGGAKKQVFERILGDKGLISANPEVKDAIRECIQKGDWKGALEALDSLER
ncbi:MAG: hypothetical protein KAU20_05780 [Nanoarchaeota archaeon]|nr:hypothetical protein [Nanoarchaeota archaeon]